MKFKDLNEEISIEDAEKYFDTLPVIKDNKVVMKIHDMFKKLTGKDCYFVVVPLYYKGDDFYSYDTKVSHDFKVQFDDDEGGIYIDLDSLLYTEDEKDLDSKVSLTVNYKLNPSKVKVDSSDSREIGRYVDKKILGLEKISDLTAGFSKIVDEINSHTYREFLCDARDYKKNKKSFV